jgi:Universal stress protein family
MASCWAEYWFLSMVRQARACPDDVAGRLEADVRSRATTAFLLGRTVDALPPRAPNGLRASPRYQRCSARGVLDHAVENGVDLIAMTTRSKGGLERWLLGRVADNVLRGLTRPLLLFKPSG